MFFENSFRDGYEYYERVFDSATGKSLKRKIHNKFEFYTPYSNGTFSSLTDENKKLEKCEGYSKEARGNYGIVDPIYKNIRDSYWNKDLYNKNQRIWYLDIETRSGTLSTGFPEPHEAIEPISLIQFFDSVENVTFVLGVRDWVHKSDYEFKTNVKYLNCKTEEALIETFLKLFKRLDPSFIHAWNGSGFDFPYIYNRLKRIGFDTSRLSNYGPVEFEQRSDGNRYFFKFTSPGHYFVDTLEVYKKFIKEPRASYSLDEISFAELGQKKVNHSEYEAFDDFYTGKYIIPENPTDEQKNSRIYQAALNGETENVRELSYSEFVYYGVIDVELLRKIDQKRNLSMLMIMISQKMGVLISDSLGTVKLWAQYISNVANLENKVLPPVSSSDSTANVVGGFVREVSTGLHEWVVSADVNSMYPLLGMVGFNMSAETFIPIYNLEPDLREIVLQGFNTTDEDKLFDIKNWSIITDKLKKYNVCLSSNGAVFKRDNIGLIPRLVMGISDDRKVAKKNKSKYDKLEGEENIKFATLYDTEQLAMKTLINSLYGAMSNKYFPLFNNDIANAITGNGRYFIKLVANNIESKLQSLIKSEKPYIIAGDTDSVYTCIGEFVKAYKLKNPDITIDQCVEFCNNFEMKVIQPIITETIKDFSERLNLFNPNVVKVEREIVADKVLFSGKKHYIAQVRIKEDRKYDIDSPFIKIMGLEMIKSSTPLWFKEKGKECVDIILNGDEETLKSWIEDIREEYRKVDINKIASVGGVSKVTYDGVSPLHISVRAAMTHNNYLDQFKLSSRYTKISGGDKCKRIYITEPNKFGSNIISWLSSSFVNEIDCVDYNLNFEKTILQPINLMVECMGYDITKKTGSLLNW